MIMGFCERCLVHHEVGVCPSEMPPEFFSETPPVATPKAQAEAMAVEIFRDSLRIFDAENIAEDDAIRKAISTALEKLLAENERLKKDLEDHQRFTGTICLPTDVPISYANLQSQLTATEARLSVAKKWMRHSTVCEHRLQAETGCTCGLSAFLSTLTAEKKEQPEANHIHCDEMHSYEATLPEKKEEAK